MTEETPEAILKLVYELAKIDDIAVSVDDVNDDEIEIFFIGELNSYKLEKIKQVLEDNGLRGDIQEIEIGFGFGIMTLKLLETDEEVTEE